MTRAEPENGRDGPDVPFTGRTAVSLLIGSPIAQVLAPARLSAMMRDVGYDGILVPFEVPRGRLDAMLPALMEAPNVVSILVTLPHKFGAARACDSLSANAARLGAVNAMRREPDGRWTGDNFDGEGMAAAIRSASGELHGKVVRMAGAGAAATSIAVSVLSAGARRLVFHDPDRQAADALLRLLERHFPGRSARVEGPDDATEGDVLLNASSCGLKQGDPLPLSLDHAGPAVTVADVITDPLITPILAGAEARGATCVTGGDMLDGQLRLLLEFIQGKRTGDGGAT